MEKSYVKQFDSSYHRDRGDSAERTRTTVLIGLNHHGHLNYSDNINLVDDDELIGIIGGELHADADGNFHPAWHRKRN